MNVWGLIHGMRAVIPHLIERGSGHVVNVASMAGKLVVPGLAVYYASKFAAAVLPSAVRTRLASGVPLGPACRRSTPRTSRVRAAYETTIAAQAQKSSR